MTIIIVIKNIDELIVIKTVFQSQSTYEPGQKHTNLQHLNRTPKRQKKGPTRDDYQVE